MGQRGRPKKVQEVQEEQIPQPKKRGRPPKKEGEAPLRKLSYEMSKSRIDVFCKALQNLSGVYNACKISDIDYTTYRYWMEKHPEFNKRVTKLLTETPYIAKDYAVASIFKAMEKHWQAAAWFLERSYPEEYGRRERVDMDVNQRQIILNIGTGDPDTDLTLKNFDINKLQKPKDDNLLNENNEQE